MVLERKNVLVGCFFIGFVLIGCWVFVRLVCLLCNCGCVFFLVDVCGFVVKFVGYVIVVIGIYGLDCLLVWYGSCCLLLVFNSCCVLCWGRDWWISCWSVFIICWCDLVVGWLFVFLFVFSCYLGLGSDWLFGCFGFFVSGNVFLIVCSCVGRILVSVLVCIRCFGSVGGWFVWWLVDFLVSLCNWLVVSLVIGCRVFGLVDWLFEFLVGEE